MNMSTWTRECVDESVSFYSAAELVMIFDIYVD